MNEQEAVNPTSEESRDFAEAQRNTQLSLNRRSIVKKARRMIWITFAFEGIHKYLEAGRSRGLADADMDVSFLAYPHRHMFHFRVGIEVFHNDRDIEFIQFKRFCERQFTTGSDCVELNNSSVEMLADSLYEKVAIRHPDRDVEIEVSEDQENGCRIQYSNADWRG